MECMSKVIRYVNRLIMSAKQIWANVNWEIEMNIVSVSRRTDIPAFYSEWFMNRVRIGHLTVFHPYTKKEIA